MIRLWDVKGAKRFDLVSRLIAETTPHRIRGADFPKRALQKWVRLQPHIGLAAISARLDSGSFISTLCSTKLPTIVCGSNIFTCTAPFSCALPSMFITRFIGTTTQSDFSWAVASPCDASFQASGDPRDLPNSWTDLCRHAAGRCSRWMSEILHNGKMRKYLGPVLHDFGRSYGSRSCLMLSVT